MKRGWVLAGVAVPAAVVGFVLAWPADRPAGAAAPSAADAAAPAGAGAPPTSQAVVAAAAPASVPSVPGVAAAVVAATPVLVAAAASQALDPRVPPIDPPAPEPPRAEAWEVADPALYQAREKRVAQEVDARFVQAAQARLPQMRAALAELQARGAAPADIARVEDKIAHLQAVQDALLRGEPLAASR